MADRWRTESGWSIELVRLTATPDQHDGTWLRVRHLGYWLADVRQIADLTFGEPEAEPLAAPGSSR